MVKRKIKKWIKERQKKSRKNNNTLKQFKKRKGMKREKTSFSDRCEERKTFSTTEKFHYKSKSFKK